MTNGTGARAALGAETGITLLAMCAGAVLSTAYAGAGWQSRLHTAGPALLCAAPAVLSLAVTWAMTLSRSEILRAVGVSIASVRLLAVVAACVLLWPEWRDAATALGR
jgi:hypothetical protein